ncbi:MBL-fold metallo-hydrolase superfamily [hydrothermal vent metagenome]|uniref:MBL-fold metallo-hydrolase superfamily n=1 Tax=hydrothermal vent metagenome TaxID=652676 RepID=A0A3B0YCY5_9ZZZZ
MTQLVAIAPQPGSLCKRLFSTLLTQTTLLLALIPATGLSATEKYAPISVEMKLEKISEHVYYVQGKAGIATENEGFISNAVAVTTPEGIVVIDALGSPSLAWHFLQLLKKVSSKPVVKVIMTHYHADHIYGLQVFKEQGAEILAPAGYLDYLESENARSRLEERQFSLEPWVNEDTRLLSADKVIDKNQRFTLGNISFDLNYLGNAHSDGDLSVLIKPDNVLITGDLIFEGRIPFTGSADTRHWLSLLENLKHTKLTALIPGHGPAASKPDQAIKLTRRYLQQVRSIMKNAVDELMSFDDAYNAADWSEFEKLPAFEAAHRKNAYGVYLSLEQELLDQ